MLLNICSSLSFSALPNQKPLKIDVAFTPETIDPLNIYDKSVLIVDILRATSTIVTAIENGASYLIPVNTPEEAFKLYEQLNKNAILGGEIEGKRIKGFHLGNSISEYTSSIVKGKAIIMRTTNGTRAINACKSAKNLVIGCFLNKTACCRYIIELGCDILIVCSGKEGSFGIEDAVFAGACVNVFGQLMSNIEKTDSALACEMMYQQSKSDILGLLRKSEHGKYLINISLEDDLILCAKEDISTVVPIYFEGKIINSDQ
ncbi:TPA: 2-phosphosulfolactate phosphatase [Candidatus Poribacteria bacterium]|nr:2-phosphosulfolactate phosphatase [Candidatus Poribacteria bacterium]